jgi:hypothetical protein
MSLAPGSVGTPNDVVAIAISQQHINALNGNPNDGIAGTISSGENTALWFENGSTQSDEGGHEHLRSGQLCPCGEEGHVEAFIAGGGVKLNWNMDMRTFLQDIGHARQWVKDVTTTILDLIARHEKNSGFRPEEMRWTGGVVLGQPFLMQRVYEGVREAMGDQAPVLDTATMGDSAGLHGTLVDAIRRSAEA